VIYVPDSFEVPAETTSFEVPAEATERTPDETNYVRRDHVVRKGETFYSISRTYEIGLDELLAWNNKTRQSALRPGDVLQVWTRK
jgi:LysM repeat protein